MRWLPVLLVLLHPVIARADDLRAEADAGLAKAVTFFRGTVSTHGGYLWKYSADLRLREGEGKASTTTIWVQPPGTPAVGMAMLDAYHRTGELYLLDAAHDAGTALLSGQMRSGGWSQAIYFDEATRQKYAYRDGGGRGKKARNISSFDDDQTQSALRLLIALDAEAKFKDGKIHEAAMTGLAAVLAAQHPNGGWSQVFDGPVAQDTPADLKASLPKEWSHTYPGGDYWWHYTFNDNDMSNTIDLLLRAATIYKEPKYREAALKCGNFILLSQLPGPQPAWAQQYDRDMHPAWARKFEPPAVSGWESQFNILTLIQLYRETKDDKWLKAADPALAWLKRSLLPDGRLARFYELGTNKPLYMTSDYTLTYDDSDTPTHYGFKVKSKIDQIENELQRARAGTPPEPKKRPSPSAVKKILAAMDDRGAWVEEGHLKYHKVDGPIIDCETFIDNVEVLSRFLAKE